MKTQNTIIATNAKGAKLVQFLGSAYSSQCYFIIENGSVKSTYSTKKAGLMTEAEELSMRVRKAINQKYDVKSICIIEKLDFSSPMQALSFITGANYNGSLIDNSINI